MRNSNPLHHRKNFLGAARMLLAAMLLALCLPLASRAQDTGYISGTVTDKSGAAVVGAEVVITNAAGSLTRTTTTNADGAYVLAALPGDTYNLAVTAKGFQKFTAQKIVLNVAEKARIDVPLTVGSITEEVVVTGESVAQVETTSSDLTSTITGKQIDQLVLNGRNFTQLVNLAPGVVNQTGQDEGTVGVYGNVAYSMNGGRTEYNNWELDGGDNMDNGSNATLNVYPNPEAIAEFKVLTSNYGAQYGRNGSGTVEVETKSGGTSFHGSAFEYLRNEVFNARSWDQGSDITQPKAPYKKHDFGYTIGGPVFIPDRYNADKKKTFFFFSEEWRREKNPSTILQNVPSDAERTGNFSVLCVHQPSDCPTGSQVSGNKVVPSAVGTALLALIPHANTTNGVFADGTPIPAVSQTVSTPTTWREELVRIDHNLTNNYRLTFRYIHDSWQTVVPNPLWGNGTSQFQDIQTKFVGPGSSFVARLTANITPTLLNEFVASYTADHIFLTALNNPALPSPFPMGTLFPNQKPLFGGKLPSIELKSNVAYGGGGDSRLAQDTGYFPWNNANPVYTYRDNVTKLLGTHTLTFGAYSAFAQKNEENSPDVQGILTFDSNNTTVSTGNSLADLLLGNVAKYKQWSVEAKYDNRYRIVEPYFQDDWRINKRLTLNLGLRLSLFGTYRERYRQAFNFHPSAFNPANKPTIDTRGTATDGSLVKGPGNPLNGIVQCGGTGGPTTPLPGYPSNVGASSSAGCLKGHLFNPAPRLGFAFDPKGDGKMAIRGGYGIFFEHTNGNEGNTESLEGSAPFALNASQFNVTGYANIGASGGFTPLFPLGVTSIPNKAVWPYVQQWHLDVQRDLPSHIVATVSYVGSKGTHLTLLRNLNQLQSIPSSQNPYKVGEAISHSIDDSSDRFDGAFVDSFNIAGNRGNSSFDQRHNLAISYIYALPFYKEAGLAHHVLGGWQISGITIAQTGTPFSVTNGTSFGDNAGVGNGVGTGSRPDLVSNPHSGFSANQDPSTFGPLAFNPAAFAIPRGLTFGNVGRNTLYLPGRVNFDFGLFKRFSISEKTGFDFRWENFNLFNHTQFGNGTGSISSALGNSDFGHLTSAHAPRRMQFGLRFYF